MNIKLYFNDTCFLGLRKRIQLNQTSSYECQVFTPMINVYLDNTTQTYPAKPNGALLQFARNIQTMPSWAERGAWQGAAGGKRWRWCDVRGTEQLVKHAVRAVCWHTPDTNDVTQLLLSSPPYTSVLVWKLSLRVCSALLGFLHAWWPVFSWQAWDQG